MSNLKKFWKGMLWGALAGGAITLLDKDTRDAMKENCQKATKSVSHLIKNPGEFTNQVKETAIKLKTTVEEIGEDISFIASKVEELKETTPQVTKMLKETKDTFTKETKNMKGLDNDENLK
jgi:gas vesicle protein